MKTTWKTLGLFCIGNPLLNCFLTLHKFSGDVNDVNQVWSSYKAYRLESRAFSLAKIFTMTSAKKILSHPVVRVFILLYGYNSFFYLQYQSAPDNFL